MKVVKAFQTADGQTFTDELEARKHEAKLSLKEKIQEISPSLLKHAPECGRLISVMVENPEVFRDFLNSHIRGLTHLRKKEPVKTPEAA